MPRGLSGGVQNLTEGNPDNYPLSQRVPKLEAYTQVAGEAEYVDDIKTVPGEVSAAFVLSTKANCDYTTVNTSLAMVRNNQSNPDYGQLLLVQFFMKLGNARSCGLH